MANIKRKNLVQQVDEKRHSIDVLIADIQFCKTQLAMPKDKPFWYYTTKAEIEGRLKSLIAERERQEAQYAKLCYNLYMDSLTDITPTEEETLAKVSQGCEVMIYTPSIHGGLHLNG
jgi:hypothetical protein